MGCEHFEDTAVLRAGGCQAALRAPEPREYQCAPTGSTLDSFKDETHRLLKDAPTMAGQRIRELIVPLALRAVASRSVPPR